MQDDKQDNDSANSRYFKVGYVNTGAIGHY